MIAMPGKGRYEPHRGEAPCNQVLLKNFILVSVGIGRIPVEIQDYSRALDSLRLNDVEINWVAPAPLYLHQFHRVFGMRIVNQSNRRNRHQAAAAECRGAQIFLDVLEAAVSRVGNRWARRQLSEDARRQNT